MKMRYLMLGLMICVAGASTINSIDGSFCGQNATPFLIFGHVRCEDGSPCSNPIVNITNTGTGAGWCADTVSGSDYYQALLCGANVSLGDLLEFDVTDDVGFSNTSRVVNPGDLENGGIFDFDMILQSIAPRITGYAPESQIHDTENATRRFNITTDQMVDVSWLIDGTEVQTNTSVTEASYTNTSAGIGIRNVSATVANPNGTNIQTWLWHVNPPSSQPPSPMFVICGEVFYENNAPVDAPYVVVTHPNTSREFVADNRTGSNFYQIITDASEARAGDLLLIDASKDGTLAGIIYHTVTIDESRSGAIRVDINQGRADLRVVEISTPPYIFDNATNIINAIITNNGTTGSDGFNVSLAVDESVIGSAHIGSLGVGCAADVTFNWTPAGMGAHTLTVTADSDGEIDEVDETNNGTSVDVFVGVPDLTVTDISITGYMSDPEYPDETYPTFGYPNNITAAIANIGNLSACTAVEFQSGLNISSEPIFGHIEGYHNTSNDTITQPNASKMRVHFGYISTGTNSYINIYDENNDTAETLTACPADGWSDWVDGDVIRMHAYIGGSGEYVWFTVDRYEYIFADATISLDAHNSTNISRIWHADPAIITDGTQSRYVMLPYYNISVIADPDDTVTELDESNNELSTPAELWYPYDFTVTNISCSPERPREGEPVIIDAAIRNLGFRSIDTGAVFYVDGNRISTVDVYAEANGTEHVSATWNALPDISHLTEEHSITVVVDPNNGIEEQDELNNDKTRSINVALANLTITDISTNPAGMIIGDTVDVIATIRNNEDAAINSTVWFCEENDSIDIHAFEDKPKSPIIHRVAHQGALMMRAYYTATVNVDKTGGTVEVYINDRGVLTCTSGNYPLAGWTEWTSGSTGIVNITLVEKDVPDDAYGIDYSISKYQTIFGNTGLTMPASESVNLPMNWTVIQKNPRLIVATSNVTNSMNVSVSGTDLAVTDVSVSDDTVWDGDLVNINATITNFGGMNASNCTVKFYDFYDLPHVPEPCLSLITTESVSSLAAGDSANITVPWIASLKVGEDISCHHCIKAEVIPQDSYIEDNPTNNTGYSDTVMVKRSRDFSVTDITFLLNNETVDPADLRMGELTTINATIGVTNLASCGGSVDVACYLDNTTPIGSITVSFPANNGTIHAEFEWDVDVHGNHTIAVIADPENETSEFDESNNASGRSVSIRAPDLVVTNLTFDPESPEEGGMVNITATVGNHGNKNASDVAVKFIDESFTDGRIHTVPYMLDTPHPLTDYFRPKWVIRHRGAHKMRMHFTRLILPEYSSFYINGNRIARGCDITNLTTDWVAGDTVTMELHIDYSEGKWGFNMDRYEYMGCVEDVRIPSLDAGDMKNVTVRWNATPAGEHNITAIIDPEDLILESDESNNELTGTLIDRGADLTVSDMRITANGTEINGTETVIAAGDMVNISAIVTNIGVRPASNFSVSFCADGTEIANITDLSLDVGEFVNVSATWDGTIGNYTINVTADYEKQVCETNESNNVDAMAVSVQGADLSITDITYTVIPPDNATANDSCSRVYDTDTIVVNTTIANQGILPADNFSAQIFYEEKGLGGYEFQYYKRGWMWSNKTLEGAGCVCVGIMNSKNVKDNIKIYDRNGSLAASPEGDGWFFVDGDEANVQYNSNAHIEAIMSAYAGEVWRYDHLSIGTGKSMNITMSHQVFTGDHPIRVFVDLEDRVCESSEENNYADTALTVHPSRDFTVNDMQLSHNGDPIGANNTILDGDSVLVNVTVGMGINKSDPYHKYRKGDADVVIIGEHEWVNVSPRFELTPYGYAQVITHPGADAIKVHFDEMRLAPWAGCVEIRDKNGTVQWSRGYYDGATNQSSWVDGDTIYVYNVEKAAYYYPVWGRTTFSIDKYRYRRSNHTTVPLDADESRYLTTGWNVSAGSHTMQAAIDIKDAVGEFNESNNEIYRTLHVDASKDPAILNITFNPEKPAVGSNVAINTAIVNKGNRTVSFTVDLWAEKTEYHPFESPHDEDFPPGNCEWEIASTYPDADWMGIHFARIEMSSGTDEQKLNRDLYVRDENNTMADNFCGSDETDVWTWVKGDTTKLSTTPCTLFPGYPVPVWGFEITDHRYKIVLNRTTLTLAAGETASVTGILRNVRAGNHSMNYTIHASIDMNNAVYEVNESNNERVIILNLAVPDFTVKMLPPTADGNIRAAFRNIGFGSADARIFFSRDVDYPLHKSGSSFTRVPKRPVQDDIDWTRIHFKELDIREGGYIKVGNERCEEDESDFWSQWAEGDRIKVTYLRASFEIDRYEFAEEDFIDDFGGGSRVATESPWSGYAEPYNLTAWIDPLDELLEGNEDDNNDTIKMGADICVDKHITLYPHAPIMGDTCSIKGIKNIGNLPAEEFDVVIFINSTNETTFEYNTTIDETISLAPGEEYSFSWKTPEVNPSDDIDYDIRIVADPENVVGELDEDNNEISTDEPVMVYSHTNYTGGELYPYDTDWVYGGVEYTVGDSKYCGGTWDDYAVNMEDVIPKNIKNGNIKLARLYLYWTWGKAYSINKSAFVPVPIEANVKFNGRGVSEDRRYIDCPHATSEVSDVAWGTYAYDVPSEIVKPDNSVIVDKSPFKDKYESDPGYITPKPFGIYGVGLLIIYADDNGVLTNYWINEGGDVIYGGANALNIEDMATTAVFEGKVEDRDMANATLWTVAPGGDDETMLYFNKKGWRNVWSDALGVDHRCVTDQLITRDNTARLQYISGNSMMSSGAFLFLRYPPDLNVINLTAPKSTVVGAHHPINVTIRNDGRSDAYDVTMTLEIDGRRMVRIPNLDLAAGENMTLHLYDWTPMMLGHVYNLTAAADVLSGEDWTEIDTDNNAMTKHVSIEEGGFGNQTGPRGEGGGSNPTGGMFTEKVTGRIMKGTKEFLSGGGGGGAGMFSLLEWIMKGAVWLVLMLFVGLGYRMEQRSYRRVGVSVGSRI